MWGGKGKWKDGGKGKWDGGGKCKQDFGKGKFDYAWPPLDAGKGKFDGAPWSTGAGPAGAARALNAAASNAYDVRITRTLDVAKNIFSHRKCCQMLEGSFSAVSKPIFASNEY